MEVTSNDYFALDGVSCSTVGLWCDTPPVQVLSELRGKNYQVGADEDLYLSDDTYADIQFRITAFSFFSTDFDTSAVYAFLRGKSKLKLSRNNGYYYKIRTISCNPSQSYDGKRIQYQITIKCAPFRYIDDEEIITLSSSGIVQNAGTLYCKPVYTLHLSANSGIGTLTVNGQTVTINIPSSIGSNTFVIDSEKMLAYDGNNAIRTQNTAGYFPFMSVGTNSVSFGGVVSGVTIKRNERCY